MSIVKVGIIQMSCSADKSANNQKSIEKIRAAAKQGAQIICLQELFSSLYFCDVESYDNFKFADGAYLGKYRKMHIPDDPSYYEKFYFTPGDLGYKVFKTKFATIGVLICWDQWYPEAARITSLMGAEMLFYPTAIGWATSQDEATNTEQYNAWQTIQRSHAVANGVPVISVNRVGLEQNGAMQFWGGSFVSNPFGTLLYKASHENEEIAVIDIDTEKSDSYRTHWPFLRDRRIDSYQPITKRYIDAAE
jgi:N-carbamoylputrescine amidase